MNPNSSIGQQNKGQATFFAQKAEKLATAVYMITDIIDAREPLRWKIREEAMEVLSLISGSVGDKSSRASVLYRASEAIDRIDHILSIARNTKLISVMNATIVAREYGELKEKMHASWREDESDHTPKLDHRFFKVDVPYALSPIQKSFPQTDIKRTSISHQNTISQTDVRNKKVEEEMSVKNGTLQKDNQSDINRTEEKKVDRRAIILALLRSKSEISVSDAMKELPGVSDKTVQRELVAMVEAGILSKKGEKRWSTYSLRSV